MLLLSSSKLIYVAGIISLSIGSPSSIQTALDFLYGEEPDVELHTAYNVMETADFLMISELKDICMKKVKSFTVSSKSCLTLLSISSRFDIFIPKLEDFYLSHLPELMKQDKMLEIDKEAVRQILTDKTLFYVSREDAFSFLMRWTEFSSERILDFREMLSYFTEVDFSDELLNNVKETHTDLASIIHEMHSELSNINESKSEKVKTKENVGDVFVLYPPEEKQQRVIFYAFNLKTQCWYQIPVNSVELQRDLETVSTVNDTIFSLNLTSKTLSTYNLLSGQSSEKKVKVYSTAFHVAIAVYDQRLYFVEHVPMAGLKIDDERGGWTHPALMKPVAKVYVSGDLDEQEISFELLFYLDAEVDVLCVAGDLLCLVSRMNKQLMVYSLTKQIKTQINLSAYNNVITRARSIASIDNHVYILADDLVIDIELQSLPKKLLWKIHGLFPSVIYESVFPCELIHDTLVKGIKGVKRQYAVSGTETEKKTVLGIDIPEKLLYSGHYKVLKLQLPARALKCHIDCPHCKDKEAEQLDLFSYQQTFSSDEDSTGDESDGWSDYDK